MSQIIHEEFLIEDQETQRSMVLPVILLILAVVYDLSPVDVIPDIPVVGYVDDFFITVIAFFNFLQKWLEGSSLLISSMFKWMKWGVVFLGIMAVSLVGFAFWGVVKLITAIWS
jgi:hypothetical protein